MLNENFAPLFSYLVSSCTKLIFIYNIVTVKPGLLYKGQEDGRVILRVFFVLQMKSVSS